MQSEPSQHRLPYEVFIAGPFSVARGRDGLVRRDVATAVKEVIGVCEELSRTYFSSHSLEEFGRVRVPDAELAARDIAALECVSVFMMLWWHDLPSAGSLIELGFALAMGRRCHWIDVSGNSRGLSEYLDGLCEQGSLARWNANSGQVREVIREILMQ